MKRIISWLKERIISTRWGMIAGIVLATILIKIVIPNTTNIPKSSKETGIRINYEFTNKMEKIMGKKTEKATDDEINDAFKSDAMSEIRKQLADYIFRSIPTHFRIETFQYQTES